MTEKRVLTTGEVAKHCGVHFRTVLRWIETGKLKAYQLPGRGDNRIRREDFLVFLDDHAMPYPEEYSTGPHKILIVEDDSNLAKTIQRVIARRCYETQIAANGFQAGALLTQFRPALMTLDLMMPGISGFDVLKFIRASREFDRLKILVISAMPTPDLERARALGADEILEKPFTNEMLSKKIDTLLGIAMPVAMGD